MVQNSGSFAARTGPIRRAVRQSDLLPQLTIGLLVIALVLAAFLAYQARAASRSHQAAVERTMRDYADFAAFQFASEARVNLLAAQFAAFAPFLSERGLRVPEVEELAEVVRAQADHCDCLTGLRFFYRVDLAPRRLTLAGGPALDERGRDWLRDTLVSFIQQTPAPGVPTPIVTEALTEPPRPVAVVYGNFSNFYVMGELDGLPVVLAFLVSRTEDGAPVSAFGYAADARAYLEPLLSRVLDENRLLPPSLTGDLANDSLMMVRALDEHGHAVFTTRRAFAAPYLAQDTLAPRFGSLAITIGLDPDLAEALIIGGWPGSRVPILVAMFALTAGLVAVAIVQMRRQQALGRMRTDFVSGVSHELRTPLAQIRLLAELLALGKPDHEEGRRRSANIIDQEARRLTYLVENILNFSRAERLGTPIAPVPLPIAREIEDTLTLFAPLGRSDGVTLRTDVAAGTVAIADPSALRQILLNLLDNAVRYGPRGQTITVGAHTVGRLVHLWVEDEGPGIPPEERDLIWEPFYRIKRDQRAARGGTGIGLAVVRELVERHGGQIWVESAAKGGARFVVELPAAEAGRPAPAPAIPMSTALTTNP